MNSKVVFLLFAVALTSVVAEPGFFSVYNTGGYVAVMAVKYDLKGQTKSFDTDTFNLGTTKTVDIPDGATNIAITTKCYVFFGITSDIFTKTYSSPPKECFKVWGVTVSPNWAKNDC